MLGFLKENQKKLGPKARNMLKIFSLVPSRKSVYFSRYKLHLYQKRSLGTWQFGKIGVLINFIIHKLKSNHLGAEFVVPYPLVLSL